MDQVLSKISLFYNKKWIEPFFVSLLVLVFISLSIYSSSQENIVNDETVHIPAGITYVKTHDIQMNSEHPPLVKYLSGLSAEIFVDPQINQSSFSWTFTEQWGFGRNTMFKDNDHERLTFWSRMPVIFLSAALALAIFFWARIMFGKAVALSALMFFCLDPTMIAYSHLVTFDLPATTFIAFSGLFLYLAIKKNRYWNFLLSGAMLGLALSSKASALAFIPVIAVILLIEAYRKKIKIATLTTSLLKQSSLIAAGCFSAIWAVYLLVQRSTAFKNAELVPQSFIESMEFGFDRYGVDKSSYIAGTFYETGQRWFLPFSFLLKSPLPLLLMLILGIIFLFVRSHRSKDLNLYILFPIIFLGAVACYSTLNWGIRYLFMIYPFIYIFAAYASVRLVRTFKMSQVLIPIFAIYYIFTLVNFFPSYIPYINELGGGKNNGYKVFAGSNVDWGQGQKLLKSYIEDNNLPSPTIAYWREGGTLYYSSVYNFESISIRGRGSDAIARLTDTKGILAVSTYLANNIGLNGVGYKINGQKPFAVISGSWLLYNFE